MKQKESREDRFRRLAEAIEIRKANRTEIAAIGKGDHKSRMFFFGWLSLLLAGIAEREAILTLLLTLQKTHLRLGKLRLEDRKDLLYLIAAIGVGTGPGQVSKQSEQLQDLIDPWEPDNPL